MPFTVYVACDLYSQKVNLELQLPSVPTVAELTAQVHSAFNNESLALKPPTMALQTLRISKLQVYNDDDGSWTDLASPTQLTEYVQLYVFQNEPQYQESQQPIPPARRPSRQAQAMSPSHALPTATPMRRYDSPNRSMQHNMSGSAMSSASIARTPRPDQHEMRQVSPRRSTVSGASPVSAYGTAPSDVAAAPSSPHREHLARAPVPEHPSQRDKISYLFDEMDTNGNRVIEPEELRTLVRQLGVDFSNATLSDIFAKGDLDGDRVLSVGEFTQLFTSYPTLLDALFFRLRDIQEARNLQEMLAEERRALENAREQRSRASAMSADCTRLVSEAVVKVRETEGEQSARANREHELNQMAAQVSSEVDASSRNFQSAQADCDASRDKEASHRVAVTTAGADVRDSEARLAAEQDALRQCQEKERLLQQQLAEAQRATERQQSVTIEAQSEVQRRQDNEHVATVHLADVQRELAVLNDRLSAAERDMRTREQRKLDVNSTLAEARAELDRVIRRLEDERNDAAAAAEREKSNRQLLAEAEGNVLAAERRVAARDQDLLTFNQRRAAMEQQERPLLEQEVRLREQRDTLDERENRFRRDAVTYFDSSRISGTAASPQRHTAPHGSTKTLSPPRRR